MSDNAKRFIRLPGSSRRYIDTVTGVEISNRKREAIAKAEGIYKRADMFRRIAQKRVQSEYNRAVESRKRELIAQGISPDTKGLKKMIRSDPEFKRLNAEARKSRKAAKRVMQKYGNPESFDDLTPQQIKALKRNQESMKAFLKFIGRRNGIPDWVPVGESDAFRKGRLVTPAQLQETKWRGIVQ